MAGKADHLEKGLKGLDVSGDFNPYGLHGLDPKLPLYRVCRHEEDLRKDILSKAQSPFDEQKIKGERIKIEQYLNSGSKYKTRFISTTASKEKALEWAFYTKELKDIKERKPPQKIVVIDLSKIEQEQKKTLINLTDTTVREHFLKGVTQINRAKSSKEVIFQWKIPKKMFGKLENPQKPPAPK